MLALILPSNIQAAKKTAKQNRCINNLRQIDAAKHQWALKNNKSVSDQPTIEDITPYLKDVRVIECPGGGIYTIGKIGDSPICSHEGHGLDRH